MIFISRWCLTSSEKQHKKKKNVSEHFYNLKNKQDSVASGSQVTDYNLLNNPHLTLPYSGYKNMKNSKGPLYSQRLACSFWAGSLEEDLVPLWI